MSKVYLATEETVAEIRNTVRPPTLANIEALILDFASPDVYVISGGIDIENRTIHV